MTPCQCQRPARFEFETVDQVTRERHVRCYTAMNERDARRMHADKHPREWISRTSQLCRST